MMPSIPRLLRTAFFVIMLLNNTARAEDGGGRLLIIPDHFEIAERFHQPQFLIEKRPDAGYRVRISYVADAESINQFLFQIYAESMIRKEVFEAEILPKNFRHFSKIFEEKNIVKSWRATYQLNEIHLDYQFTDDLSREQIQALFSSGYALGEVDGEVQCSGEITSALCDQTIKRLPLFNQYAIKANDADSRKFGDYGTLANYMSFYRLGKAYLNLDTSDEVSRYLSSELFLGRRCRIGLDAMQEEICRLIAAYSPSESIEDALRNLSDQLFRDRDVDASRNFFILDETQFSVTNLGRVDPSHCSVYDAFCSITE